MASETHSPSGVYEHALLTRFSAVLHPDAPPPDPDWLHYRLGFFYDATYPSVRSQRGAAPFRWLVLLDDRCPDWFREQVEELAPGVFEPVWTHEPFRRDSFAAHVSQGDSPWLITTRIDSDDAMAVDFMAAVQAQFEPGLSDRLFVNFPRGVQIDRDGTVYRSDILSSPFLSLIERRRPGQPPDTVYVAKHARARAHGPLREVRAPVMWAQVVHGTNLSNIVNGSVVSPAVVGRRFDLTLGYDAARRGLPLRRSQLQHLGRRTALWVRHPGEATKWAEARAWSLRGTHEHAQDDGRTLSDRVEAATADARTWARETKWQVKERVNARATGLRIVAGDVDQLHAGERVVLMAEWSRGRDARPDALRAATAYATAGWPTLVICAREPWVRMRKPALPEGVVVAQRPNSAYDFGSWRDALVEFPDLAARDRVILTNDSLVGPVGSLGPLLSRIEASEADVWAPTMNHHPRDHLQSYFTAWRGGVLATPPWRDFFRSVTSQPSKTHVVRSYKFGLSGLVDSEGLTRR